MGDSVAPSGSCAEFVRHRYPELFPSGAPEHALAQDISQRTFEFTEFLSKVLKVTDGGACFPHKVTYQASCHILRGPGLRDEPKQLLAAVRGLEFLPLAGWFSGSVFFCTAMIPRLSRHVAAGLSARLGALEKNAG